MRFLIIVIFVGLNACDEAPAPQREPLCFIEEYPPSFDGGWSTFYEYVYANLKYPDRMSIEGKVFVAFVVNPDGSVSDAEVVKGLAPFYDNEAMRVVRNSPKWSPAKQFGKQIRQRIIIPISFRVSQ